MQKRPVPFEDRKRMTHLAEALVEQLTQANLPMVSSYRIFVALWDIYAVGDVKYLRGSHPSQEVYYRTRSLLKREGILRSDKNYPGLWRVTTVSDVAADEAVFVADPFCYISHISAMQRYGITNRRPEALCITQLEQQHIRAALKAQRLEAFAQAVDDPEIFVERIHAVRHPGEVRGRPLNVLVTKHFGSWRQVRGTHARIGTIGQTFLDMLELPERCGGMRHILSVWEEHAPTYLEEIISSVEEAPKAIHKVRAGYILQERLGVSDERIQKWKAFAQRGGSRLLDPENPYVERYSEDWMISINV